MKKLTEYKELDAATFDNSTLVDGSCKNYRFSINNQEHEGTLCGVRVVGDNLFFLDEKGFSWPQCAEIITRYPRDVPEGVAELPEDKPFFAYVGEKFIESPNYCKFLVTTNFIKKWHYPDLGEFKLLKNSKIDVAIDISTEWAADKFPEIVEAMEYEPVYKERTARARHLIGHKLGNQYYDLEWNEVSSIDNLFLKPDVFGGEEPPDYEEWDKQVNAYPFETSLAFEAGKARGRWEALQEPKNVRN